MSCKAVSRHVRQLHVLRHPSRLPGPSLPCLTFKPPHSKTPFIAATRRWSTSAASPINFETATLSDNAPVSAASESSSPDEQTSHSAAAASALSACPGCGGLAQTIEQNEAGYYSLNRHAVKSYLRQVIGEPGRPRIAEDDVFEAAVKKAGAELVEGIAARNDAVDDQPSSASRLVPPCDRCHDLLHHHKGMPILHPHIDSLHSTISESPYKYNHVYHVIDAADFPLSLVPKIHKLLSLEPLRSKNRRAQQSGFRHGKKMDMSFVVTRSDLLAPKKEQVDRLMPYLVDVLRDALGRTARDVRLGNVRCVSAKRDWWAKELKADVWRRGGGQWLVGKVNVGKSKLFESIFPKGKAEDINFDRVRSQARLLPSGLTDAEEDEHAGVQAMSNTPDLPHRVSEDDEMSLLPPARKETPYPSMPTVSHLPGTTASPIRIPFGSGKGELIDLPGLVRSSLERSVQPEHHSALILKSRPIPEQYRIKSGQSLLLGGGLLRITPVVPHGVEVLAYPFLPPELKSHVTATAKVTDVSSLSREGDTDPKTAISPSTFPMIPTIAQKGIVTNLQHAGTFELAWDVTKARAGPLTKKDAVGLKPDRLPFKVLSVDILIEGVGWVELTAQVRRGLGDQDRCDDDRGSGPEAPRRNKEQRIEVEVFSPKGNCVGSRRPMGAWELGKPLKTTSWKARRRP